MEKVRNEEMERGSGVFRISKRGAKFLLATSAHTEGGQTKFSKFFLWRKIFFWPKGGMAQWPPLNTPLKGGDEKEGFESKYWKDKGHVVSG